MVGSPATTQHRAESTTRDSSTQPAWAAFTNSASSTAPRSTGSASHRCGLRGALLGVVL